jgi:PhnB protein
MDGRLRLEGESADYKIRRFSLREMRIRMPRSSAITRRLFAASTLSAAVVAALPARSTASIGAQSTGGNQMTTLTLYLLFDGNCHLAMEFYKSCFGGELTFTKVKDSPAKDMMPPVQQEKTLNAELKSGNLSISASDWLRLDETRVPGNTVCLYLRGGSQELKALFEKLSEGADVTDPFKETFFGFYGALNDKFGVRWMFTAAKNR